MSSAEPSPTPERASPGRDPGRTDRPRASHRSSTGYLGALWIVAPLMPGLAAVVTVGTYLFLPARDGSDPAAPMDPVAAIGAGLAVTVVTWVLGAALARRLVSAPRAQLRLYAELLERTRSLGDRADSIDPRSADGDAAVAEARTHIEYAAEELEGEGMGPALRWALASGYMSVMRGLHRAEEVLITVESTESAVGDALHDALSLEGSMIGNRDRLVGILRLAVQRLSPAAAAAFLDAGQPGKNIPDVTLSDHEAREALREVRHAINEYRDDRHDGLVRARNRLVWTMLAVGITTYLLLSLALVADVSVIYVQAVAVFYLVGAIVGLFNRLRIEAGQQSAVEDFGLSQARLVVTPLVSGLAAVAGVYLVAMTPALLTTTGTTATPPPLTDVFDLSTNTIGVVYAAIFGLAPSTLTNRLTSASARLERDLQSTEAASEASNTENGGG